VRVTGISALALCGGALIAEARSRYSPVAYARKKITIIAGPNGAGKTTFAREFLPREADCLDFINVDLIAAGLSPFDLTGLYYGQVD